MKRFLLLTLMIFCGVAFSANENFLFFQTATEGNLKKMDDNHYLLTIQNAPKYVNYFSDRPVRKSGIIKLAEFNSFWTNEEIKNNFKTNPPNVALVLVDEQGKRQDLIAIATNPTLSKEQLTYELQPIKKQKVYTGSFKYMLMITDDVSWNPGGF